jgi:hypothetical protein
VVADGEVVGRIYKANAAPVGSPWMWTLAFWHHEGRTPTHGYAPTRETAMAAFARAGGESDFNHHRRSLPQSSSASRFTAAAFPTNSSASPITLND